MKRNSLEKYSKRFDYFDHDADIGIIGEGKTIDEAFEAAAEAMFRIMSLNSQHPSKHVHFEFNESDYELALVTWLNQLIAAAGSEKIIFSKFKMKHQNHLWVGDAWGAPWEQETERGVEVKGATLTMLSVTQNDLWKVKCVVDV